MSTVNSTATQHANMLLEIDVQPGDAALLRVISTLHQRQAHVRKLTYDDSSARPRLSVRVAKPDTDLAFLANALRRCIDVVSVRVRPFEAAPKRRAAGRSPDGLPPATLAPVKLHAAGRARA